MELELEGNATAWPLPASGGACTPWLLRTSSILQAGRGEASNLSLCLTLLLRPAHLFPETLLPVLPLTVFLWLSSPKDPFNMQFGSSPPEPQGITLTEMEVASGWPNSPSGSRSDASGLLPCQSALAKAVLSLAFWFSLEHAQQVPPQGLCTYCVLCTFPPETLTACRSLQKYP